MISTAAGRTRRYHIWIEKWLGSWSGSCKESMINARVASSLFRSFSKCGKAMKSEAMKSTVDEIRQRFDADLQRFSNLQTGQSAPVDAPLAMAPVAQAAALATPHARHVLDVGCGAGNYTLKLLEQIPNLDVTLVDLSKPMLDRAKERVRQATTGEIATIQG